MVTFIVEETNIIIINEENIDQNSPERKWSSSSGPSAVAVQASSDGPRRNEIFENSQIVGSFFDRDDLPSWRVLRNLTLGGLVGR